MKLSLKDIRKETTVKEGEKSSLFHEAVGGLRLPFLAIDRLCDALGVNYTSQMLGNGAGITAIMRAAVVCHYDIVEFLAKNKKADLSIIDKFGKNIYTVVGIAVARYFSRNEREDLPCVEG
jgi:hypothetical protein